MRVISMVPSWTETLIRCGVDVVGRTRFCIHPADRVGDITIVGGTKQVDWEKVRGLDAGLLLLDQEENPKAWVDESPVEILATHITDVADVAPELARIADRVELAGQGAPADALRGVASRWRQVQTPRAPLTCWRELPGVMRWLREPAFDGVSHATYLIWREPWMACTDGTFVASMLHAVGLPDGALLPRRAADGDKYPAVDLDALPADTVILASSEPFPFHRKHDELQALGRPVAIVDGEAYSWFGLRSLEFLNR